MGLPNSVTPMLNGGTPFYLVNKSVRFRASATAYLNRTPSIAGNRRTWTWSGWVKRGTLSSAQWIFDAFQDASNFTAFFFNSNDTFGIQYFLAGTSKVLKYTTQVFRDPAAWYHLVVAIDTTPATPTFNVYVNGIQVTAFGTNTNTVSQNEQLFVNNTIAHNIGRYGGALNYFDGYIAELNFIDGQSLTPSSFGAFDNNGIWQPVKYTGTYGTNGFYLPFNNTTSTTTLVADSSGNSNNWTPNNISLTAGSTYDSMFDSPTVSNVASNYCVFNPLYAAGSTTFSNGNLQAVTGTTTAGRTITTMGVSTGKWYWEITPTSIPANVVSIGVVPIPTTNDSGTVGNNASEYGYLSNGQKFSGGSATAYGASYVANDVIGVALDCDGGTITFYKNNVSQGTAFSITAATTYIPAVSDSSSTDTATFVANFGQRPFSYTPPSGYLELNTENLPSSPVGNGAMYMAATLYTGAGATQSISNAVNGTSFQPDFVWIKSRSGAFNHSLYDVVRGINDSPGSPGIFSNLTSAESVSTNTVSALLSDGFTISGAANTLNASATTYVAWQWKAGGTGVTNTSGSTTSTVSVSAQSGFSIVSYTGTGAAATIGHGLGVAPQMILVKKTSAIDNWGVYHVGNPSPAASYALTLNTTSSAGLNTTYWNATAPTSSVFSVGTAAQTNTNGASYIAYCFSPVQGYSAFGSYTANGLANGPYIYTGFRPRWLLLKRQSGATESWILIDTSRDTYNLSQNDLYPNLTNAQTVATIGDILSNGFKLRSTTTGGNTSTAPYVYAAFAENPFNFSRAR